MLVLLVLSIDFVVSDKTTKSSMETTSELASSFLHSFRSMCMRARSTDKTKADDVSLFR